MGPSCISWQPDRLTDLDPIAVVHVTKSLPSDSGVARHAVALGRALSLMGTCTSVGTAANARDTQRAVEIVRLAAHVKREIRRTRADLVVFELSGRALAEFFAACVVVLSRRRPVVWLVAHDPPELSGPPFLLSFLDRRGGRRLALQGFGGVGRALEGWLVGRVECVLGLSELGAQALRERYPHARVRSIPLPSELLVAPKREAIVYCPASVAIADVRTLIELIRDERLPASVTIQVGHLNDDDRRTVESFCETAGVADRVRFTDFLDQVALDESFATASLVVRWAPRTHTANWAAASGPIVSALAAGCAVLSTDPRGSRQCVALVGVDLTSAPERVADEVVRLMSEPQVVEDLGRGAAEHIARHHTPEAVHTYLASIWIAMGY